MVSAKDCWGYYLERLIFHPEPLGQTVPAGLANLSVALSVFAEGHCEDPADVRDPLHRLELNLVVTGTKEAGGTTVQYVCAWHQDRDLGKLGEAHRLVHPLYHFQFGGKEIWGRENDHGQSLILESPRFAYPPMDAILAVDFVLTNFYPAAKLSFREEAEYQRILGHSHMCFVRPYVLAIAGAWDMGAPGAAWAWNAVWPQLPAASQRHHLP